MQTDDQVAEWLVRWEDARTAGRSPPPLEQLPLALHESAREGMRLLLAFAATSDAPVAFDPGDLSRRPPDSSRYRFEEFLAQGGMGEVWRGHDALMQREVALKVLRRRIVGGEFRDRFEEEARHVAQLQHPAIVPVYDLGELPDGRPFFVMKLIRGQTLAGLLNSRATPAEDLPRWATVFEQVCQAVAFAHARGLIHRDLKPSNVMLGEFGEVQVMDWGIAKVLDAQPMEADAAPAPASPSAAHETAGSGASQTRPGQAKGTPEFMAPEQARGEVGRVGKASDVFGLGGILCVILTDRPTFARADRAMAGDLAETFERLDGCGADTELIALAKACLAPDPEGRPADAAEVARLMKRYHDGAAERRRKAERVLWLRQMTEQAERAGQQSESPDVQAARSVWRQRAMEWVRAQVAAQAKQLASDNPDESNAARQMLESLHWAPAMTAVRYPALAKLPEAERRTWEQFWEEIDGLLRGTDDPAR